MVRMALGMAAVLLLACGADETQMGAEEAPPAVETVDMGPEVAPAEEALAEVEVEVEAEDVAAPAPDAAEEEEAEEEASADEPPEGETPTKD